MPNLPSCIHMHGTPACMHMYTGAGADKGQHAWPKHVPIIHSI